MTKKELKVSVQDVNSVVIASNTIQYFTDNVRIIRFHKTDIIKFYPDNTIQLFNGGFFTKTTKDRIKEISGISIIQKNFDWFVVLNGVEYPFFDGIKIKYNEIVN